MEQQSANTSVCRVVQLQQPYLIQIADSTMACFTVFCISYVGVTSLFWVDQ